MNEANFKRFDEKNWCLTTKLSENIVSYLWDQVAIAEEKNIDMRHTLAGNISRSLSMEDPDNVIIDKIFAGMFNSDLQSIFTKHVEKIFQNAIPKRIVYGKGASPKLDDLWVNFQKKYEYNPLHDHGGMFSFVIWMKIPYDWENEKELPWIKGSNTEQTAGNFVFVPPSFKGYTHVMNKSAEGQMVLFPSHLYHTVYPFYTSDEERVSISGNIYFELDQ